MGWIKFKKGIIKGVVVKELKRYLDERGWLVELYREDELNNTPLPNMAYASLTLPGIARGPHAHHEQTDLFCFVGPGNFKLVLWDNREDSETYGNMQIIFAGQDAPKSVSVPPGVVHGYKSLGPGPGLVFNAPDKLYAGWGKKEPVDEIRYENDPESPFKL